MERRIGEWQGESERLRPTIERIAAIGASSRMLSAMLPSHGYQGFRAAPPPSGWVQMGESWVLWWSGRQIAQVMPAKDRDVRVHLDARKMWQTKDERAASIAQGKRYAERWCAAEAWLWDAKPSEPLEPLPGLPPTREQQQQVRRLAEAGAVELVRIKEALEPRRPPKETKPRLKDTRKAWVRAGLQQLRRV